MKLGIGNLKLSILAETGIAIGNLVLVDGAPWLNEWQGNYKDEALSSFKLRNDFVQKKLFTHSDWPRHRSTAQGTTVLRPIGSGLG